MNRIRTKNYNTEIKNFSLHNMPELANIASFHKYRKGQIIFYEGHIPYGIFILTAGDVEINYGNANIEKVSSPAFIGFSAFKNMTGYSGTAKADTNCEVYFLSTSDYKSLNENRHPVSLWVNQ